MYLQENLTEEQTLMLDTCRSFVNSEVIPFVRDNWQQEWNMEPAERLPAGILSKAHVIFSSGKARLLLLHH